MVEVTTTPSPLAEKYHAFGLPLPTDEYTAEDFMSPDRPSCRQSVRGDGGSGRPVRSRRGWTRRLAPSMQRAGRTGRATGCSARVGADRDRRQPDCRADDRRRSRRSNMLPSSYGASERRSNPVGGHQRRRPHGRRRQTGRTAQSEACSAGLDRVDHRRSIGVRPVIAEHVTRTVPGDDSSGAHTEVADLSRTATGRQSHPDSDVTRWRDDVCSSATGWQPTTAYGRPAAAVATGSSATVTDRLPMYAQPGAQPANGNRRRPGWQTPGRTVCAVVRRRQSPGIANLTAPTARYGHQWRSRRTGDAAAAVQCPPVNRVDRGSSNPQIAAHVAVPTLPEMATGERRRQMPPKMSRTNASDPRRQHRSHRQRRRPTRTGEQARQYREAFDAWDQATDRTATTDASRRTTFESGQAMAQARNLQEQGVRHSIRC